jgi:hypothetical protein
MKLRPRSSSCWRLIGADHGNEPIIQTEEGILKLITRPTKPSWPGPLIIYYVGKVPAETPSGEEPWEVAVSPDGTFIENFANF